ncbi:hypothetical protein ACPWSR_13245 [Alloiococcus sp. CFN-8]|uniref:hypothetical protein n=1 Tax=Alloiococcus sp. CFN-8 TaxID=3416081 RepID=UPI003CFA13CD
MKKIYLFFVCTPSIVSRAIKKYTKDSYTHVAISVDPKMREFYSFARRYSYSPLPAGFVLESIDNSFYRRNSESQCKVIEVDVTEEQYTAVKRKLKLMYENRYDYKYNLMGLLLYSRNVSLQRKYHRFCSEFVSEILKENNIMYSQKSPQKIRPIDLMRIENSNDIYEGTIGKYTSYNAVYSDEMVMSHG